MRSVVIYPEPGYQGEAFTSPAKNNWHVGNLAVYKKLQEEGWTVKVWPCEVDTTGDIGLAFDHPTYDCKIPDTAMCVNLEPPVIRPRFFARIHGWPYKKILSCSRPYCDDKKIFWSAFPAMRYEGHLAKTRTGWRCAISSGDKRFDHPEAMYERRRQIYLAYGKHIDLYGWGWQEDVEIMQRTNFKGPCDNKVLTLSHYHIATVIENQVIPGFTSEKYWDAAQAGCMIDYTGSVPDYGIEEAFPPAWAARIVGHLNTL